MSYGLVLGAGGVVGEAFHRGVLRALSDHDLDARGCDVVVGTSAGSIVAAAIRRQTSLTAIEPLMEPAAHHPFRLPRTAALRLARRPKQALNGLLLGPAFASGRASTEMFSASLRGHGAWPDAALWIAAVRLSDGRRVVFGKPGEQTTDVASAVAASCAIPGYFKPVRIGTDSYIDGAVHSPTNADLLADTDVPLIVISSPMSIEPHAARPRWDLPLRLLFHRYLLAEQWALHQRGRRIITIEPDAAVLQFVGINMLSGRRSEEIEESAYRLASQRLTG